MSALLMPACTQWRVCTRWRARHSNIPKNKISRTQTQKRALAQRAAATFATRTQTAAECTRAPVPPLLGLQCHAAARAALARHVAGNGRSGRLGERRRSGWSASHRLNQPGEALGQGQMKGLD